MKFFKSKNAWGTVTRDGAEVWDTPPVFLNDTVSRKDKAKLVFYPKKFFLYRCIARHVTQIKKRYAKIEGGERYVPKILDVGCGTGATVIDFKKLFGRGTDVVGLDVVTLQVELAQTKLKQHGVWAEIKEYDGTTIPFPDNHFDAIYTSDVLGHVEDVPAWLAELSRVLKPGGVLAMFSESKLGKHAYVRKYLHDRGLNVDPHAEFHISLYSKATLRELLEQAGFGVKRMRTAFWASFFVHPDEFYHAFRGNNKFFVLKSLNWLMYHLKRLTHPFSTAAAEFYGLVEMLLVGQHVEAQGYVILARKNQKS